MKFCRGVCKYISDVILKGFIIELIGSMEIMNADRQQHRCPKRTTTQLGGNFIGIRSNLDCGSQFMENNMYTRWGKGRGAHIEVHGLLDKTSMASNTNDGQQTVGDQ